MIISVTHMSRASFDQLNFSSTIPLQGTNAYISIYGHDQSELPAPKINHPLWFDGIQLQFDDADSQTSVLKPMSQGQAKQIVEFVTKLHDVVASINLVVHCFAGISRSAAVARFVNEYCNLNLPAYRGHGLYNASVFRKLNQAVYGSLREQYGVTD